MSDDDDYEDIGLLKKALDVELPADFDPTRVPQTGEEYLQHVMYERSKCKTWVTADVDRDKFKNRQTFKVEVDNSSLINAPIDLLPAADWQQRKIDEFTELRAFLKYKNTKEATISSFDEDRFAEAMLVLNPKYSDIIRYTQAANTRKLQIIANSLDALESGTSFNQVTGAWIYAILALLEKPLSPDSCHVLREFAKKCRIIRAKLTKNALKDIYLPLNLFVCIIANFYDQLDLADPRRP